MDTLTEHTIEITKRFAACKSKEALLSLLNQIDEWQHQNPSWEFKRKEITLKQLNYFLHGKKNKYHTFSIAKKSGGERIITAPHRFLRKIQRLINICFNACHQPMPTATGFVAGRSIVDNAKLHTERKYVYNIDLKDFFPSISFHRIKAVLIMERPFGFDEEMARLIANICCHDGKLPQGAPTSPFLSNLVCIKLDAKMYNLSRKMGFVFSRYADDITISSNENIYTPTFKETIYKIIKDEGFSLNPSKERLQRSNVLDQKGNLIRERQVVTGIIVNKKTALSKHYVRSLKAALHNWEKYGYEIGSMLHEYFYKKEKGYLRYGGNVPRMEEVLHGKIQFLGMVRGKEDNTYRRLRLQYDQLCKKEFYTPEEFIRILEIWEVKGLEKAMDAFYSRKNMQNG